MEPLCISANKVISLTRDGNTVLEAMRAFLSAKKSAERFNVLCMSKPIAT